AEVAPDMLRSTPFEIAASEARERLSQVRAADGNDPRASHRGSTHPVILAVHQHAGTDRGGDRSAQNSLRDADRRHGRPGHAGPQVPDRRGAAVPPEPEGWRYRPQSHGGRYRDSL